MSGKGNEAYEKFDREMSEKYGHLYQQRKCSLQVGPIPKLDGEVCVCKLAFNHTGAHECSCGSWFEGCGKPAEFAPWTP